MMATERKPFSVGGVAMSGHTATPWKTGGRANKQSNFGDYRCVITHTANDGIRDFNETTAYALGGITDSREIAEANAAFIVTACNSHADLVKALESLVRAYGAEDGRNGNSGECWDLARAALAKVSP